jgi:hypothetical protein
MAIVKLENGNIILDLRRSISSPVVKCMIQNIGVGISTAGDYVVFFQSGEIVGFVNAYEVGTTQVEPAAPVAFNGSAAQLADLMASDFFVLSGQPASPWTQDANGVWNDTDNIGIGTQTPGFELETIGRNITKYTDPDGYLNYFGAGQLEGSIVGAPSNFDGIYSLLFSDISNYAMIQVANQGGSSYGNVVPTFFPIVQLSNQIYDGGAVSYSSAIEIEPDIIQMDSQDNTLTTGSSLSVDTDSVDLNAYDSASSIFTQLRVNPSEVFSSISDSTTFQSAYERVSTSYIELYVEDGSLAPISSLLTTRVLGGIPSINTVVTDGTSDYSTTIDQYTDYAMITVNDANVLLYGRMMITTTSASLTMSDMTNDASFIAVLDRGDSFPGLKMEEVPEYADNAAALLAGLDINVVYRTGDLLKIVH